MQNNIPFHRNNMEYNPLFAKMQDRFCAGGTIAEKMQKKAEEYMRSTPSQTCGEYHMTHANSLPKRSTDKKKRRFSFGKSLFSMRNITTACMALLIGGTILFSGASVGNLFSSVQAEKGADTFPMVVADNLIFTQEAPLCLEETAPPEEAENHLL